MKNSSTKLSLIQKQMNSIFWLIFERKLEENWIFEIKIVCDLHCYTFDISPSSKFSRTLLQLLHVKRNNKKCKICKLLERRKCFRSPSANENFPSVKITQSATLCRHLSFVFASHQGCLKIPLISPHTWVLMKLECLMSEPQRESKEFFRIIPKNFSFLKTFSPANILFAENIWGERKIHESFSITWHYLGFIVLSH